jgi:Ni2+-binding GTPase involved in maturation of urease and hydrogenase
MKIHLLSGFLGSGKTTAIQQAYYYLVQKELKVGVITNDQGISLVDGGFFEHLNIPNRQVLNGCFCCNYNDLENGVQSLVAANQPDIIFAESVGSCTDIVATVMKPLLHYHQETPVTLSTFADIRLLKILLQAGTPIFDESVRYIYFKQLEEAPIIVVTKIDLVDQESLLEIKQLMNEKYGDKILLYQNSLDPENIQQWLQVLNNDPPANRSSSLQIDYDIYGEGERKLAWYDQEVEIYSNDNNGFQEAIGIIKGIYKNIHLHNYTVGHLKFLLNKQKKISFTSTSGEEIISNLKMEKGSFSTLLINARVQTSPELLSRLISEVMRKAEIEFGCKIIVKSIASFQPGYPNPTHRLVN